LEIVNEILGRREQNTRCSCGVSYYFSCISFLLVNLQLAHFFWTTTSTDIRTHTVNNTDSVQITITLFGNMLFETKL